MIDYDYPDIFLGEAVQKDLLITDGEVTVVGDDYTVTDDTFTVTNSELESEAFELYQSINSEQQLQYGSCETGRISFIIRKNYVDPIIGTRLKVYIIPNHEASKILQIGEFKVAEDKQSDNYNRHSIVAYDAMYDILNSDVTDWYDDILQDEESYCYLEDFRDSFLGLFPMQVESTSLVNDDLILRRTIENDRVSGADIVKAICELNGVFGMITNEGKFRFKGIVPKPYRDADTTTIEVPHYIDIQYEDYGFREIKRVKVISNKATAVSSQEATGSFNTYIVAYNPLIADYDGTRLQAVADTLCDVMTGHMYCPCVLNALGNPVHEVGDPIIIKTKYNFSIVTYIFERRLRGIQALRDTYTANGVEYLSDNLNSMANRFKQLSQDATQAAEAAVETANLDFVELIRNIGYRLLDEPTDVTIMYDPLWEWVEITYTDPDDIETDEPVQAEWAGTVIVRSDEKIPLHRWDGLLIDDTNIRDEYATEALQDSDEIEVGKTYYYGIFPYDTRGWYRYTKVVSVTTFPMPIPEIRLLTVNYTDVTVFYTVPPEYGWSNIGIVYKKNSAPQSKTDGKTVDITEGDGHFVVEGLSELSPYYFKIFSTEETTGREFLSDAKMIVTQKAPLRAFVDSVTITKSGGDALEFDDEVVVTKL